MNFNPQPFTYYGGKQTMLRHIMNILPPHKTYVEPFAGGASVFWNKRPAEVEVLNIGKSDKRLRATEILVFNYDEPTLFS